MHKKLQYIFLTLCLGLPGLLPAALPDLKGLSSSGLDLTFSGLEVQHPNRLIQHLQSPCRELSTTANHIGDACAVWQAFTQTFINKAFSLNYQLDVNYQPVRQRLHLLLTSDQQQVSVDMWLGGVAPRDALALTKHIDGAFKLADVLDHFSDVIILSTQVDMDLTADLILDQLTNTHYPLNLQGTLDYSSTRQQVHTSMQVKSPHQAALSLELEGDLYQQVTLDILKQTVSETSQNVLKGNTTQAQNKLALTIKPTYLQIAFDQQGLFYEILSWQTDDYETYSLSLLTETYQQQQQQYAQKAKAPTLQNLHGGLAAFLDHPISFRLVMTPAGYAAPGLSEWSELWQYLQLQQRLIDHTFLLKKADTMDEKKVIQRQLNQTYFDKQETKNQLFDQLDGYFDVHVYVNGQPFEYREK